MPRQGCPEYTVRPIGPRPSDVVVSGVGSRVRGCGTISKLLLKEFVHGLDVLSFSLERLLILISDPCSDYQKQRVNVQVVTHDKQGLFREIDVDKRGKISLQQWIDFLRQSMTPCVSPMTRTSGREAGKEEEREDIREVLNEADQLSPSDTAPLASGDVTDREDKSSRDIGEFRYEILSCMGSSLVLNKGFEVF